MLLTPPTLAILFLIWYYEHPAELLFFPRAGGADNRTELYPSGHDKFRAVYVMSATPSQAAINLILIVGSFMGDTYNLVVRARNLHTL